MARNGFQMPLVYVLRVSAIIYFVINMCVASSADATTLETFPNYMGIRGMGMGGAQINAVNDETAILVNPAGLGKLRNYYMTIVDPELTANDVAIQSLNSTGVDAAQEPQALLNYLQNYPDKYYFARAQLMPSFVLKNFGIGLYNLDSRAAQVDSTTGNFDLNWRKDTGAVLSYNFRLWEGRIKIGASARLFNRFEIKDASVPRTSTGLTLDELGNEGGAVGLDAGIILSSPTRYLPSVSAVVRDVGDTEFTVGKGMFQKTAGIPNTQRQTIDAGFAIFPILSNTIRMTVTGEYRNVMSTDDLDKSDAMRRVHAGAEVNFRDVIFVRGGMYQRYWTAGLEIATEHFQIQGASYGQEIGTGAATKEDRRYSVKFVYRF